MPISLFSRRKARRRAEADLIEMGPEREEPPQDVTPPGRPVPYDASLYLQREDGEASMYRRGAADVASPEESEDRELGSLLEPEEVHVLQIPGQAETPQSTPNPRISCPGCGSGISVPWGRPVVVTCPRCGTTRTIH